MSSPLLSSDKNYKEKFLDSGAYGAVFKITSKADKSEYAMKQIDLKKIDISERNEALNDAKNEYILYKRNIPHVLKSYGSHYEKSKDEEIYRFSVDLMEINLANFIEKNGALSFEQFIPIFSDVLLGKFFFPFCLKENAFTFYQKVFGAFSTKRTP